MLRMMVAALVAGGLVMAAGGPAGAQTQRAAPETRAAVQLSFAPIVKSVAPAVVNVYASRMVTRQRQSPFFDDPFFRRFFGDQFPDGGPGGGAPGRPERMQSALGSGVIVDASGVIVTNYHVIKDADEVKIALADKREFECDILLKDERTDLAILKVKTGQGFPTVPFGDSDGLEVGDLVLAIGNPFGVGQTVTSGIVSALARTQVGITDYQFFIQTDAAINPGNSGGALVDMNGRLIGINTAIFSRSGGSIGIGFAIPVNMVKVVVESAKTGATVRRPWLGAELLPVTAEIAEGLGLDRPKGALVGNVAKGGAADKAGLRPGDLILTVDGADVSDPDAVAYRLATRTIGGTAQIGLSRGNRAQTVALPLTPAPETVPRDARRITSRSPFAGAEIMNLSPAVAEELRLSTPAEGVVVAGIEPGSPAMRIGLQRGDVIAEVNGERVETTRSLVEIAAGDPGLWRIAIVRNGRLMRMAFR